MRDSPSAPRQIKFDTDSQKFLIDSGASAHLWNRRKDFIYYRPFSPQGRKNDQVLGVSGMRYDHKAFGQFDSGLRITSTTSTRFTFTTSGTYRRPQLIFLFRKYSPNNAKPRETPRQVVPSRPTPSPSSGPAKMVNKPTNMFP